jgi:hypothetical protein
MLKRMSERVGADAGWIDVSIPIADGMAGTVAAPFALRRTSAPGNADLLEALPELPETPILAGRRAPVIG